MPDAVCHSVFLFAPPRTTYHRPLRLLLALTVLESSTAAAQTTYFSFGFYRSSGGLGVNGLLSSIVFHLRSGRRRGNSLSATCGVGRWRSSVFIDRGCEPSVVCPASPSSHRSLNSFAPPGVPADFDQTHGGLKGAAFCVGHASVDHSSCQIPSCPIDGRVVTSHLAYLDLLTQPPRLF